MNNICFELVIVKVMSRYQLLKKYKNLESKVLTLRCVNSLDKKLELLSSRVENLIWWTERSNDNNQIWCKTFEEIFEDLLEEYFQYVGFERLSKVA